ncbi:MAG TPA: PfkB family carbohydrate kinase, partial [Clostridia bacterium]|nr:PfkB family carbohydrate kinase [Clostridia bacterium]
AVCRICNLLGVKVLLNPAPAQTIDSAILPLIEYVVPNETELQILVNEQGSYEELAQKLYKKGVKHVIVTLGEDGCLLVNHNGVSNFPAQKVKCIDTTAAGDAFIGGFIVGISQGLNIYQSVDYANKAAGFAITRRGAQVSLGTKAELDSFFTSTD